NTLIKYIEGTLERICKSALVFFFQAEDGIRDFHVTGVQTCALPICGCPLPSGSAIAQNQKEEDSRRGTGMFGRLMGNFSRHPDRSEERRVGKEWRGRGVG